VWALTEQNVADYLRAHGWVEAGETPLVEPLGGGVSNVVLRVRTRRGTLVLKQPHRRLRVQQEWISGLERVYREAAAMRLINRLLPPGTVPTILFEDRANYILAMSAVPEPHRMWKHALLAGEVSLDIGRTVARYLATLHARTLHATNVPEELKDRSGFIELRVEPYYWRMRPVHPELGSVIDAATRSLEQNVICFVHADYSPKNMLVHDQGVTIVDHETAHVGDPAFDVGFFLSHLALKTVHAPANLRSRYLELFQTVLERYEQTLHTLIGTSSRAAQRCHETPSRARIHFALCCLARLDGASPVEYFNDERRRQFMRSTMKTILLERPTPSWSAIIATLAQAPP